MNIKLFDGGQKPTRKHHDDAGMDCYAAEDASIEPMETRKVRLGFGIELPIGYELQIRGRSSVSASGVLVHLGTVDAGYRGEISAILTNLSPTTYLVSKGARIAQGVVSRYVSAHLQVVETMSESERGTGGFGSTGK